MRGKFKKKYIQYKEMYFSLCVLCLVAQLCLTLCDPMNYSPLWVFSRQEYWSGLPCSPPWDLPNSGIEPRFPALQADSLPSEPPEKPMKKKNQSSHEKKNYNST
ncbi:unnamed protein product [Rangifer tarandus platyrhynchus]|uniref:Uncharacterized protein n=2 Tax=Rangifer tarandus platyrhynchus TaxID=3082113 RepID=A0ABN8YET6_RANTA|nr:unnamed protein product [Rangifer tarandus platyrhynchus]